MVFEDNELVMYKENGKIYSAGFNVNSVMLQHGISPISCGSVGGGGSKTGGTGDSLMRETFNNLAIPAGLYYFDGLQQGGSSKSEKYVNEDTHLSEDFYSTLLGLAENIEGDYVGGSEVDKAGSEGGKGKHKKTKKQRLLQEHKKRKTRKH
jgi:hypothetical protein